MKTIELLKENENAKNYIKSWFVAKLAKSIEEFKEDEEFKQIIASTTVTDKQINTIISESPRSLLDALDSQGIMISILANPKKENFSGSIYNIRTLETITINECKKREEFDRIAIQKALPQLEENLVAFQNQELIENEKKAEDI